MCLLFPSSSNPISKIPQVEERRHVSQVADVSGASGGAAGCKGQSARATLYRKARLTPGLPWLQSRAGLYSSRELPPPTIFSCHPLAFQSAISATQYMAANLTFLVAGNLPFSPMSTRFQRTPRGRKCSSLQAMEQPQHPIHRFKSMTIPHLGMHVPPFFHVPVDRVKDGSCCIVQ